MNLIRLTAKLLVVIFFLGIIISCATVGNKEIMDQSKTSQIIKGQTTKKEVLSLIGEPSKVTFMENDCEVWDYVLSKSQTRAVTFVPVVGLFAGGMDMQTYTLTIKFDKNGVVQEIGKGKMIGGAGGVQDK